MSQIRSCTVCTAACFSSLSRRTVSWTAIQPRQRPFLFKQTPDWWSRIPKATSDVTPTKQESAAEMEETQGDDVVGAVVTPSIVNKPWLRATAVLGTLLLGATYWQKPLLGQGMKLVHCFAFASWFGSSVWVLLLSPKIMFSNLGRQTFGKLQGKLFPQFFGFSVFCIVVLLGTGTFANLPYALLMGLASSCVNWLVLEPVISTSAVKRYALENAETRDQEKIDAMRKTTSKYHALSSCVGLITLCSAAAHGYWLSSLMTF